MRSSCALPKIPHATLWDFLRHYLTSWCYVVRSPLALRDILNATLWDVLAFCHCPNATLRDLLLHLNIPNATFVRFVFAVSKHPECHVARSSLALSNIPNAILCEIFSCTLKKTNICSIVATTQRKSCVSTCDTMTVALCWCTQAASTWCGNLPSKRSAIVGRRASAAALTPNSLKGCGSSNSFGKMVVRKTWCQLNTGHALSNRTKKREKKKVVLRRRFPCKNQWNVTMPETCFCTLLRNEKH